ncbi:hypothetical protein O3P69_019028 [Scylla paramamosain]|uniref:Receptor ligand binding region domain-containing protein n=1 Tax=Scylla paramamosain TaxID=85552 RepID=A0AAW0T7F9_SCYPA
MKGEEEVGVIIFGSDQEVAGVMRAVRRNNATGSFSWIGSDGWSARSLVSSVVPPLQYRIPAFHQCPVTTPSPLHRLCKPNIQLNTNH